MMKCKHYKKCGNYTENKSGICDYCLMAKYNLEGRYDSCDQEGMGDRYINENHVLKILDKLEQKIEKLKKVV